MKMSNAHNKKRSLSPSTDDQNQNNKKRKTKQILDSVLNKKQLSGTKTLVRAPKKLLQLTTTNNITTDQERINIEEYGMEIDPNEPRYCTCNQVSFGRMIKCDNESCPLEWFHFQCANVDVAPKADNNCGFVHNGLPEKFLRENDQRGRLPMKSCLSQMDHLAFMRKKKF
ncbi:unnamed protein product [Didymodactylos carnosus]|uniref:Zinc finger PHD-type domain-containing protein n=1 Tax=Didymodactylos carnosus TaxID=1234261 RepID=A0A814MSP4_9BILA|nr:unnamed protein product [Didymodactylos carnosus]CAF3848433.1 unnamed protein product [Didymodactylos carnosus]